MKIKKVIAIIPLIIGVLLLYGIISGNMEEWIHSVGSNVNTKKTVEHTYDVGVINNYKEAFDWYEGAVPYADVYDPDNKVGETYFYYGITVDETKWYTSCYNEDIKYNSEHKLTKKYSGMEKYNPDKLVNIGEEFERKYVCADSVINKVELLDTLSECDRRYYLCDGREGILPSLREDGTLNNPIIYDLQGNQLSNQKFKFVKVEISLSSKSEWVQEIQVVPKLHYFQNSNDILDDSGNEVHYYINSGDNGDVIYSFTGYPIYQDVGYFDNSLENSNSIDELHYPMRKGESITYNVIYVVPEEYINNAYLVFDDIGHTEEFSYNLTDTDIFKIIE